MHVGFKNPSLRHPSGGTQNLSGVPPFQVPFLKNNLDAFRVFICPHGKKQSQNLGQLSTLPPRNIDFNSCNFHLGKTVRTALGGGFGYFLFSSLFGEDSHFD